MRRHCQFTVKRPEKRVDLTVTEEQQPCGVQVVEWVGLVAIVEVYAFHHLYLMIKWRFDK